MEQNLKTILDRLLQVSTENFGGVPGVVAMATDRNANFYEGAAGKREMGGEEPMTTDSVFALASCTKAITGVGVMQLIEEGRIRLQDPAKDYVPELCEIGVLTGFDEQGQPQTRAPKRDITINDLMLHTSGFGYEFASADDLRYRLAKNIPMVGSCTTAGIKTVLLHDPGEAWTYGVSIDWLGKIVEQQRGKRLGAVLRERIFEPLDMKDTGFTLTEDMKSRGVTAHLRSQSGALTPAPGVGMPDAAELDCGGMALSSTVGDYMKFIRMMLNDGAGSNGHVLKAETVAQMCEDGLKPMGLQVSGWTTAIPQASNSSEFYPGMDKGWAYSFMVNREDTASGRPAGSLMWAGLMNLYYWIDRRNRVGGFWATQILPFHDPASYAGFVEFETTVYRGLRG